MIVPDPVSAGLNTSAFTEYFQSSPMSPTRLSNTSENAIVQPIFTVARQCFAARRTFANPYFVEEDLGPLRSLLPANTIANRALTASGESEGDQRLTLEGQRAIDL